MKQSFFFSLFFVFLYMLTTKGRLCTIRLYSTIRQKTPFEVLSLSQSASTAEIKSKYKELAKTLHPDKKSTGDLAKFQELVQAYELLVDPNKRSYYIKSGYGWGHSQGTNVPPPGHRPPSYTNAHWAEGPPSSHHEPRYTNNATFMSILAGIVLTIATANIFYFQASHASLLSAADRHHFKSSNDLRRAREEARLFGNDRGVKRVIESRMKLFRENEE
ncbi:DnaJ domain-containing protein [Gilbertella persicaria]|uniref:DnaJ domain-containing protein n=1 Tax=Gilbertella persicaria TaxID=101096 RepID=UPI00221E8A2C|nr:DnaJ domain-containing protein [Gilbertella persicaria]KAI8078201.1 DnaJ domain-containing protein [Gilbertella persicaria]